MNDDEIRCCVIDDEPLAARLIASYVEKTPFLSLVGTYGSAREAIKPIMDGEVDAVFLDIRMSQLSGMEFARIVPKNVQVVFVTAYSEYAIDAFRVGATDYLVKPVSFEEFTAAALRIRDKCLARCVPGGADGRLLVKVDRGMMQINTPDIVMVEGLKDYVKIHLAEGRTVVTLSSMKGIERHLPSSDFMRVHRSYIVSIDRISRIDRQKVVVAGRDIPVGDSYRPSVAAYIASHTPSE
ncbi:MAG: LytTR family DNA-binding domain-containing protein [Duncaniella sp.]|nr:LytTR family DNA-binding domain-containing protein [Duncaniella sp.]MDE6327719.1 LytTR family DNA-binding domain-containing protein [Duncaniella sp.]MDE6466998.1 LytTR family DNA-binding domain-containing protein [Duncaniella sp.]